MRNSIPVDNVTSTTQCLKKTSFHDFVSEELDALCRRLVHEHENRLSSAEGMQFAPSVKTTRISTDVVMYSEEDLITGIHHMNSDDKPKSDLFSGVVSSTPQVDVPTPPGTPPNLEGYSAEDFRFCAAFSVSESIAGSLTSRELSSSPKSSDRNFVRTLTTGTAGATFTVLPSWTRPRLVHSGSARFHRVLTNQQNRGRALSNAASLDELASVDGGEEHFNWMAFVLCPDSSFLRAWHLICGVLVVYECFEIPTRLFNIPVTVFVQIMTWIIRCFWPLDIFVCAMTGFVMDNGQIEMKPQKLLANYFQTWFAFDFALVVADMLEVIIGSRVAFLKMVRSMRLFRLGRVLRFRSVNGHSELAGTVAAVVRIVLFLIWLNHVMACCWYGVSKASGMGSNDSWIVVEDMYATSLEYRYFTCFHYGLASLAGADVEVRPYNTIERIFTVSMLLFAFVVASVVISSLTTTMTHFQAAAAQDSKTLQNMRDFLIDNNISDELAERVQRNARHGLVEERRMKPNVEIFRLIVEPLRAELHFEIYWPLLRVHLFFERYGELRPDMMQRVCHLAIKHTSAVEGYVLFNLGYVPTEPASMLFFNDGAFSYSQVADDARASVFTTRVMKGQWACEAVMWTQWVHCGSLSAETRGTFLALDSDQFRNIVISVADPTSTVHKYATAFVACLNQIDQSCLSDLSPSESEIRGMVFETLETPKKLSRRSWHS